MTQKLKKEISRSMKAIKPQYIEDKEGNKVAVLLPMEDYQKLLEMLEDIEDVQAYDLAKNSGDEVIPFDQSIREIEEMKNDL